MWEIKIDGGIYGAERNSQFALQNVFDVINRRWESGKPLIVTTNLELDSIRNVESDDITRARIMIEFLKCVSQYIWVARASEPPQGNRR